jgi:hypothetical protein
MIDRERFGWEQEDNKMITPEERTSTYICEAAHPCVWKGEFSFSFLFVISGRRSREGIDLSLRIQLLSVDDLRLPVICFLLV